MKNTSKNILLRNISSMFFVQIANYIVPMISIPIIVRIIGPDSFGVINYAGAIIAYFALLINYGFNFTATRKVAQNCNDHNLINKLFSEVLGAKIVLFICAFVLFIIATAAVNEIRDNWKVMWFSFIICIAWVFTPDWLYHGTQKLHIVAYFNLTVKIIFTVLILFLIKQKSDFYLQPLLLSFAQIVVALASYIYAIFKFNLKFQWPGLRRVKVLLWEDRIVFFSSIVISLYTTTNIVILGIFSNSTEVGYYTAAQRFVVIAQSLINMPLALSIFPYIGKAFSISKEEGLIKVRRLAPFVIGISFVFGCILFLIGPELTTLFYGVAFSESQQMFRIMAFVPFIVSLSNLFAVQVMLNLHRDNAVLTITTIGAVFSIILCTILAFKFGGIGASYATLLTECIITLMAGIYLATKNISIISINSFHPASMIREARLLFAGIRK